MTGARTLKRAHAALEPEERFRVALAALARDDEDEVRRLIESCPTRLYREPDAAFMNRWETWRVFAVGVTWLGYALRSRAAGAEALRACAESAAGRRRTRRRTAEPPRSATVHRHRARHPEASQAPAE